MSKRLDGINKMNKQDLARSRKIVLDSIGESDEQETRPTINRPGKQLDGLVSSRKKQEEKTVNINPQEARQVREFLAEEELDDNRSNNFINGTAPSQEEVDRTKQDEIMRIKALVLEKRQARKDEKKATKDKIKAQNREQKNLAKQVKERRSQEKKVAQAEAQEEIIKQEQKEQQRIEIEKQKAKETKAQLKVLKQEAKRKIKQSRKKKRQQIIEKVTVNFKKRHKNARQFIFSWTGVKAMSKFLAWFVIWFIVLGMFLYFVLAIILLRFNSDKKMNQVIVNNLPVPALITKFGFINYHDYIKLRDNLSLNYNDNELRVAIREKAVEQIILQNLIGKYGIDLENKATDKIYEEINNNLVLDQELNKVAWLRLNSIKEFLGKGGDFLDLGKKYGDDSGQVDMDKLEREKINQIDEIIITADGYYFIKDKDFIFIKAITIADYLENTQTKLKVWTLVK